jgi:hypothetical protein
MPAAIFFVRLDLEKNSSFLDRHYLKSLNRFLLSIGLTDPARKERKNIYPGFKSIRNLRSGSRFFASFVVQRKSPKKGKD